jgi:hypothetical protein
MKILNGFSFNMVTTFPVVVRAEEISLAKAREIATGGLESTVGHADTAAVYGQQLGVVVPAVRSTIALQKGEVALIGSYRGPRMPEGARELPAGATIQWLLVTVS